MGIEDEYMGSFNSGLLFSYPVQNIVHALQLTRNPVSNRSSNEMPMMTAYPQPYRHRARSTMPGRTNVVRPIITKPATTTLAACDLIESAST